MTQESKFAAGRNIAMKVPPHLYDATVSFYRDVGGLKSVEGHPPPCSGVVRCDEIEPLPEGFQAFWISSPTSIIHLVCEHEETW